MEILLDRDGVLLVRDGVCWQFGWKENEKFIGNCVNGLKRKNISRRFKHAENEGNQRIYGIL